MPTRPESSTKTEDINMIFVIFLFYVFVNVFTTFFDSLKFYRLNINIPLNFRLIFCYIIINDYV